MGGVPGATDAGLQKDLAAFEEKRLFDLRLDGFAEDLEFLAIADRRDQAGKFVGAKAADDGRPLAGKFLAGARESLADFDQ